MVSQNISPNSINENVRSEKQNTFSFIETGESKLKILPDTITLESLKNFISI